ncbi:MAG: hypothetical protein P9M14_07425 [Candidatus Alcyoniella australis]|nr:hypothetical protein [Candidatus Alcyoniella australis]
MQGLIRLSRNPGLRALLFYLLRALIPLLLMVGFLRDRLTRMMVQSMFGTSLNLLGQLDIYCSLFYVALPVFALLVLTPSRGSSNSRAGISFTAALIISVAATWLLAAAPFRTRPEIPHGGWPLVAAFYVGANLFFLIGCRASARICDMLYSAARRAVLIADLLLPMLVWSAYRRQGPWYLSPARLLPAGLLCIVPLLPWLATPLDVITDRPQADPQLRQIWQQGCYQVLCDPADGSLILAQDGDGRIVRLDPARPERWVEHEVEPTARQVQAVALDSVARKLIYVAPSAKRSFVLNADTLRLERVIELDQRFERMNLCRTWWDGQRRILAASCTQGSVLVCADGATLIAAQGVYGSHSDLLLDPQRDVIHVVNIFPEQLMMLDAQTFEVLRTMPLPASPNRIAIATDSRRLFISHPLSGLVLVVDADSYQELDRVRTFPGVRVMAVDAARGYLILAGLSPLIEVRTLDGLELIDRLWAPPWARWIDLDPTGDRAFISTANHGVWELDLGADRSQRKHDLFFDLLNLVSGLAQNRLLGLPRDQGELEQPETLLLHTGPCPEAAWLDPADTAPGSGR